MPEDDWEVPDFGPGPSPDADDASSLDYLYDPAPGASVEHDGVPEGAPGRELPAFSVTNPAGTVTATALLVGRLQRIELAPHSKLATAMTEDELAQEILLVGRLAGQKARSELFTVMMDQTAAAGQDPETARRFLRDDVGLPTPEESTAAQAEAFGARYRESHG
jgi:hypothetical protein